MAVPAHDTRDYEFAKKFNIEIIPVLEGGDISKSLLHGRWCSREFRVLKWYGKTGSH